MALRDDWDVQREKGRSGERFIADWLRRGGMYVIPSYDYTGDEANKAPRLEGLVRKHVIPDLDVAGDGQRHWVEVKTKTRPDLSRCTDTWDHGFEERLLLNYQRVQEITGTKAWLCVYETSSELVLLMPNDDALNEAAWDPRRRRRMNDGKPGIYVARDSFFVHDPQGPFPRLLFAWTRDPQEEADKNLS